MASWSEQNSQCAQVRSLTGQTAPPSSLHPSLPPSSAAAVTYGGGEINEKLVTSLFRRPLAQSLHIKKSVLPGNCILSGGVKSARLAVCLRGLNESPSDARSPNTTRPCAIGRGSKRGNMPLNGLRTTNKEDNKITQMQLRIRVSQ